MIGTLAQLILDAHHETALEARTPGPWRLRPDHVILDELDGAFALWAFRSGCGAASRARFALIGADRRGVLSANHADDGARILERAAVERGVHFARPGTGRCEQIYAERFAAPGRLAVGCGPGMVLAGALGTLVLPVSRLEAAAVLATGTHTMVPPRVRVAQLSGGLLRGVSGHDLAVELSRRLGVHEPNPLLELRGSGVERLAMRDRFAIAAEAAAIGVTSVIVPSDEVTRAWMRAHGREADWKRFALDALDGLEGRETVHLDLETVEPWLKRGDEREAFRAVRHAAGTPVRRVVVGPRASYGDWACLAELLRGRSVGPGISCIVVPGSGRVVETARETGIWADLAAAGVRFESHSVEARERGGAGVALECATDAPAVEGGWRASLETCAAAALSGVVTDPREMSGPGVRTIEPERYAIDAGSIVVPAASPSVSTVTPVKEFATRGTVLLALGDDITTAQALPWGPRAAGVPPEDLEGLAFTPVDPAFPSRAKAAGGGWIVAGREFLVGPRADLVAWVLARLGVRTIVARGYAPGVSVHLAHAGILPLAGLAGLVAGDELELPGGIERIDPDTPVTVRDLTRGAQLLLTHALGEHELAVLRAGGLMGLAADEGRAA